MHKKSSGIPLREIIIQINMSHICRGNRNKKAKSNSGPKNKTS